MEERSSDEAQMQGQGQGQGQVQRSKLSLLKQKVKDREDGRSSSFDLTPDPTPNRDDESLGDLEHVAESKEHAGPRLANKPSAGESRRAVDMQAAPRHFVKWTCRECDKSCIPVRSESRCLCGHRLKEHREQASGTGDDVDFVCASRGCRCTSFFYIVAEGAWILRCRCKHKHIEHTPVPPYGCVKPRCTCSGFDSPWVCNCGHPWISHSQSVAVMAHSEIIHQALAEGMSHVLIDEALKGSDTSEDYVRRDGVP